MEETKIKGFKIIFSEKTMTINNSYQLRNIDKMKYVLEEALQKTTIYNTQRTINSLLREWIGKNNLYKIHLFRKNTQNSIFKKNIKKRTAFIYFCLSASSLLKYKSIKNFYYFKTKVKEKQYKNYIKKHRKNIKKAFQNEIIHNPNIYLLVDRELISKLSQRILDHDKSKYSKEEFDAYRKNFYPINKKEKEDNLKNFEKAWEHHYKNNSHHWQNRQYKKSFNINNDEEVLDVLENVLDWAAMGYTFKDTVKEYYDKNKDNIILCSSEKIFLEHIIYDILLDEGVKNGRAKRKRNCNRNSLWYK